MNALRLASLRSSAVTGRRFASSGLPTKPYVPDIYKISNSKAWLSDPSTYPLIGCLGFAGFFVVGMFINEIMNDKDVNIRQDLKHKVLRDYGTEHTRTFTETFANSAYTNPVGLGVDHDQWMKDKAAREAAKKL